MVKTKIICTLGPASSTETVLRKMMLEGMDVARLNFSHGKAEDLSKKIGLVRRLNEKYRRRLRILGDLQGHRIRIGQLPAPLELKKRQEVFLSADGRLRSEPCIPFDYEGPLNPIKKGFFVYIDDGNIALEVLSTKERVLRAKVIVGGLLKPYKGVNIPEARLDFGPISLKDKKDVIFCETERVDYIAQSFVRTKKDVLEVRKILKKQTSVRVIAKIENAEGIRHIDEIIKVADGIMIARGDMGVSMPIYQIPVIQKQIIRKCNRAGKFVITATQMLESMTEHRLPTRAETTDVANAILDGTDFVMLSAESAVGKFPVETVRMMNNIIKYTELHAKKLKVNYCQA